MGRRPGKNRDAYIADAINRLLADDLQSGDYMCSVPSQADSQRCRDLFLGLYDVDTLRSRLRQVGLLAYLEKKGYADPVIVTGRDASGVSRLQVYNKNRRASNLLIDSRFSETLFTPFRAFCADCDGKGPCTFNVIVVEWVETRDPRGSFSPGKPQLPGQKTPGLGVLRHLKQFVGIMAGEVARDGFMNVPDHIHAAIMYADAFRFVDPEREGYLRALLRDLRDVPLGDIAWGYVTGTILDAASGEPERYRPSEQLYPVSDRLNRHFDSKLYAKGLAASLRKKRFRFERALMEERRARILAGTDSADL